MADILVLTDDLLFGSRVQAALASAGHGVQLTGDRAAVADWLGDRDRPPAAALVVDLTDERLDGSEIVRSLARAGLLERTRTLGFYSHVDAAARRRAEGAGFDAVIPRSRMAREGADVLGTLLAR
jgi:DNA-binding response OmpR family regulator